MYLDAFWAGVLAVLFVEFAAMFLWAVVSVVRGKR